MATRTLDDYWEILDPALDALDPESVALTERGHQAVALIRCQAALPASSWLTDFIATELERRIDALIGE